MDLKEINLTEIYQLAYRLDYKLDDRQIGFPFSALTRYISFLHSAQTSPGAYQTF
jgi:hypothetical protein